VQGLGEMINLRWIQMFNVNELQLVLSVLILRFRSF